MDFLTARLPEQFVARLKNIIPAEHYAAVLRSFSLPKTVTFRVNTLLADESAVIDTLPLSVDKVSLLANAYQVTPDLRSELTHSQFAESGIIYIQDIGSMMIANLVQVQAGEEVLDLAAAPGGKTLYLACAMENRGRIAAVEAVKARFFQLQNNVRRANATIVKCFLKDGRKVGKQVPERFDRVLLDAPCSSESRFDVEDPHSFQFWSEKKVFDMQRKQKQLLYSAIQACKPGGRVIYSTCSFAPEENEAVVDRQLTLWGDQLDVIPLDLKLSNIQNGLLAWGKQRFDERLQRAVRLLPNGEMGGFFVCGLKKLYT